MATKLVSLRVRRNNCWRLNLIATLSADFDRVRIARVHNETMRGSGPEWYLLWHIAWSQRGDLQFDLNTLTAKDTHGVHAAGCEQQHAKRSS